MQRNLKIYFIKGGTILTIWFSVKGPVLWTLLEEWSPQEQPLQAPGEHEQRFSQHGPIAYHIHM